MLKKIAPQLMEQPGYVNVDISVRSYFIHLFFHMTSSILVRMTIVTEMLQCSPSFQKEGKEHELEEVSRRTFMMN